MRRYDYIYQQIINDQLGKGYIRQVNIIKEEQCAYCKKFKKKECRLKIMRGKCVNEI
ncbi:MAG: hypothetical protein Q4D02_01880 [Clostridia bacterium]|nr:hypothetical protein [Clostridia bacterium]